MKPTNFQKVVLKTFSAISVLFISELHFRLVHSLNSLHHWYQYIDTNGVNYLNCELTENVILHIHHSSLGIGDVDFNWDAVTASGILSHHTENLSFD